MGHLEILFLVYGTSSIFVGPRGTFILCVAVQKSSSDKQQQIFKIATHIKPWVYLVGHRSKFLTYFFKEQLHNNIIFSTHKVQCCGAYRLKPDVQLNLIFNNYNTKKINILIEKNDFLHFTKNQSHVLQIESGKFLFIRKFFW